jgi:hypothetical protein
MALRLACTLFDRTAPPPSSEYMLSNMRNRAVALACLREGLSPNEGRGFDDLSTDEKSRFADCYPSSLSPQELHRAFQRTMSALVNEIRLRDGDLAKRVGPTCTRSRVPMYRRLTSAQLSNCQSLVYSGTLKSLPGISSSTLSLLHRIRDPPAGWYTNVSTTPTINRTTNFPGWNSAREVALWKVRRSCWAIQFIPC